MTDFIMTTDADGVATIVWDTKGKSMNVMTLEAWDDLDALVDQVLADDAIKGAIITSGKPGSFAGGMDLKVIAKMKEMAGDNPAKGLFDGIMNAHRIMRKIERAGMDPKTNKGGKPFETTHAWHPGAWRTVISKSNHPKRIQINLILCWLFKPFKIGIIMPGAPKDCFLAQSSKLGE